jgi:uncharacterized membrane protein YkvA (DUF1232 family)
MNFGDFLIALLVIFSGLTLIVVGLIALLVWKLRIPLRGVVAIVGALVYFVSPIDVLPEALLGPLGLVDDAGVVSAVVLFVYKLVQARRMLEDGGVPLPGDRRGPSR